MIQTRRSTRRTAFGEGDMPGAVTRSSYSPRGTAKHGGAMLERSLGGAWESISHISLSYSEPNRLAIGQVESRALPAHRAIVGRQTAITARGASCPPPA